jgi:hypothetical protein
MIAATSDESTILYTGDADDEDEVVAPVPAYRRVQ